MALVKTILITLLFSLVFVSSSEAAFDQVVFKDEFNGPAGSLPSSSVWDAKQYTAGDCGQSMAYYNGWSPFREDGQGHLLITAAKSSSTRVCSGQAYRVWTSGELESFQTVKGEYVFRARVKVAGGNGTWNGPGYVLPQPHGGLCPSGGGGELDLSEQLGKQPNATNLTAHRCGGWGDGKLVDPEGIGVLANQYHTYGMYVYDDTIQWRMDGKVLRTIFKEAGEFWPFNIQSTSFLIDLNIGGCPTSWANCPDLTGMTSPQIEKFDFVRVLQ